MMYIFYISISGEKPIRWRLFENDHRGYMMANFNLRREANPLATPAHGVSLVCLGYFNLRREANPLATHELLVQVDPAKHFSILGRKQTRGGRHEEPAAQLLQSLFN